MSSITSALPTLSSARAVAPNLPAEAPEERAFAALTLAVQLHRRDTHVQRMEIATPRVTLMRRDAPAPATPFAPATHAVLASVVERRACTACGVEPGLLPCPYCNLAGCDECARRGWVPCGVCEGSRTIALADVRMIEDRTVDFRATFTPTLPSYLFEEWLQQTAHGAMDPPDSLLFDVEQSAAFAPYREVERPEEDAFHGHRFEDALVRARHALERLRQGEVFAERLRAWARPFLLLSWPDVTAVALANGDGSVHVLRD